MKWLIAALIGSLSGWLIAFVTNSVAISVVSGGAIGFLATVAFFGNNPLQAFVKVAGAMAVGCLVGWMVSTLTGSLRTAMIIGMAIGALSTIAFASQRPFHSVIKVFGSMAVGFAIGWAIGNLTGNYLVGMLLAIPLGLPILILLADKIAPTKRRPF
jgi:hypothetical protein